MRTSHRSSRSVVRSQRAALLAAAILLPASQASAQQLTDIGLFSNKNWASGSNAGFVLSLRDSGGIAQTRFNLRDNTLFNAPTSRRDTPWTPYSRNAWNHIAVSVDTTTGSVTKYINGGQVAQVQLQDIGGGSFGSLDTHQLGLDLNLGQDGTGGYAPNSPYITGRGFYGLMDDAAIWRRSVNATELLDIYNAGVNATPTSLGGVISSAPAIGTDLVGYYNFDGNVNDLAGNAEVSNGTWRGTGALYDTGLFGQAGDFRVSNYVNIGAAASFPEEFKFGNGSFTFATWFREPANGAPIAPPPPPSINWTGAGANNNASTAANWNFGPSTWNTDTIIELGSNTTAALPAVFNTSLGQRQVSRFTLGAAGVETFINFQASARLIGVGPLASTIAPANSTVNISMAGGEINVWGNGEETTRLVIAQDNARLNLSMSGNAEVAAGTRIADATRATGFRRPIAGDPLPRVGDDILLVDGANAEANITMNGNSIIYTADVLYPGDHPSGRLNVIQNNNSKVLVGWDVRMADDGHSADFALNWTMNGSSQFIVDRDHALGEGGNTAAGEGGTINVTVNDSALFQAGGRVFVGAGSVNANVTLNVNGGEVRAGSLNGSVLVADETGAAGATSPMSQDGFISIGHGANARVNVRGGVVNAGRNIYVGQGGGNGTLNISGGSVNTLGNAPTGTRAGNLPDDGTWAVPSTDFAGGTVWADGGGDFFIATSDVPANVGRSRNRGQVVISGGSLDIARDLWVGGFGEEAAITVVGESASTFAPPTIEVGGNMFFGFVPLFGGIEGENNVSKLGARIKNSSHPVINVTGNLTIGNSSQFNVASVVDAQIDVAYAVYRPTAGARFTLVDFGGSLNGVFASVTDPTFDGIVWTLEHNTANTKIDLIASTVYIIGDADGNGSVGFSDLVELARSYNNANASKWSQGDFDNVGGVDFSDLLALARNYGATAPGATADFGPGTGDFQADWALALSMVPEPTTLGLLASAGLLLTRRRR